MIYNLKNTGRSKRIVSTASGKRVGIEPGQTVSVELKDRTAKALFMASQRGSKILFSEDVVFPSTDAPLSLEPRGEDAPAGGEDTLTGGDVELTTREKAIFLLQNLEEGMVYPEFVAKAKPLLGDAWPGGTPKKKDLVELIEGLAKTE